MKHIAKYISVLILFPTAIIVSESHFDQCQKIHHVYTDSPPYTIETQFRALWLKPTTNNLYYAAEAFPFNDSLPVPIASPNWKIFDLHPSYRFGFDIGMRGIFHTRNTNLWVNWQHFKSHARASHLATGNNMVGPFSSIGPDAADYKCARGCVTFDFNEVNVRYGQYLQCGNFLQLNLAAGISWARIKQQLDTIYSSGSDLSRTTKVPSSFSGVGPHAALDFSSIIFNHLTFTGQLSTSLLLGTVKNHTLYISTSPEITALGNPIPNVQQTSTLCRTQLIPYLQERLGLGYSFTLHKQYTMRLEAGYEAQIFLNAIQSTDLSSGVINVTPDASTVGVFARTFARTLGNFALGGPYIAGSITF